LSFLGFLGFFKKNLKNLGFLKPNSTALSLHRRPQRVQHRVGGPGDILAFWRGYDGGKPTMSTHVNRWPPNTGSDGLILTLNN